MNKKLFGLIMVFIFAAEAFCVPFGMDFEDPIKVFPMWIIISIFLIIGFFIIFGKIRDREERLKYNKAIVQSLENDKRLLETVTKSNRGTGAERNLVLKLLKNGIPAQTIFHDLYVEKFNGRFSQIDLVVATNVGIIVFEIKDYSGWIFGNGNYQQWTQVLAYGKRKHRFYNPIMQNNKHIADLRKRHKQFEKVPFYSIVVFYGDCELKDISFVPQGTFIAKSGRELDVVNNIINNNEPATFTDKWEVIRVLKEAVQNGDNIEAQTQHIENVRDMLGKDRIFD